MMKPETYVTAVFSTAHVQEKTMRRLESDTDELSTTLLSVSPHEYGVRIYVNTELVDEGIPAELRNLMTVANKAGARWMDLDCDGETYDGLPVWEW